MKTSREVIAQALYELDPGYYDPEGAGVLDLATLRAAGVKDALDRAGYAIVPVKPTNEMIDAADSLGLTHRHFPEWSEIYREMVKAAVAGAIRP